MVIRVNEPTEKQVKFAKEIADKLDLKLPKKTTKQEYWKFINDHISEYRTNMLCVRCMCEAEELGDIFGYGTNDLL